MCGIFGWMSANPKAAAYAKIATKALSNLKHRGPDGYGWQAFDNSGCLVANEGQFFSSAPASILLAHTRLSIIDLSELGHQPMRSADGRYTLIFNGEIYNYLELRAELKQSGIEFQSHTDTEVLLNALIKWGKDALVRLNGMFAFALYDNRAKTLFLARDFFGIKPLYFYSGHGEFYFSSELPVLLSIPGVPRDLAPQQVYNYLALGRYDCGADTFLKNIFRLPPAHMLFINLESPEQFRMERYWKPDLSQVSTLSYTDAAERFRELFLESVKLHLRSDVPLGVALSGGIDSSSITCAVRHLQPDMDLHTFSFIAKDTPICEERWARIVAERCNAIRHTVEVDAWELASDIDDLILHLGEPFGSTSIYAQYRVFKLARDMGIKVTLDGQGADELLAGYWGYPGERMATILGSGNLVDAWRFARSASDWPDRSTWKVLKNTFRQLSPDCLVSLGSKAIGRSNTPSWLDSSLLDSVETGCGIRKERGRHFSCRDKVRQALAYELTWEGLQGLLRHGDRSSMAFSVESRVPFLTREIAEFSLSLPEEYLIDIKGCTKSVFRHAMRGIVPDKILDRRDKIGFATPEQIWMKELRPWVDRVLDDAAAVPYLNIDIIRKEVQQIFEGKRKFDWRIWRWINYIRWVTLFDLSD